MRAHSRVEHELQRAQQQAMEQLLQQCIVEVCSGANTHPGDTLHGPLTALDPSATVLALPDHDAVSFLDYLADACEDASERLQELSPEDVAARLADAVAATRESLRGVQGNVQELLADPDKLQALCQHFDAVDDGPWALPEDIARRIDLPGQTVASDLATRNGEEHHQLAHPASNEEALRNVMLFADNMCAVLDQALTTITEDEYHLAAQLSLGIAQRLFEAGQTLFTSIGDEKRRDLGKQSERITIEELPDDTRPQLPRTTGRRRSPLQQKQQKQQAAVLRSYLEELLQSTRDRATKHPFLAALLGTITMPFVGLAVPVASVVGLALVLETYYPEHATLTLEMFRNFVQMMKLWLLLLKISARQCGLVARRCLVSWQEHAVTHGYVATGMELASTGCSLGWLGISYLCSGAVAYARGGDR